MAVCPGPLTAKIQVRFLGRFVADNVALSQVFSRYVFFPLSVLLQPFYTHEFNPLKIKPEIPHSKTQVVPRSKHFLSQA
jgi:hypothetical protein